MKKNPILEVTTVTTLRVDSLDFPPVIVCPPKACSFFTSFWYIVFFHLLLQRHAHLLFWHLISHISFLLFWHILLFICSSQDIIYFFGMSYLFHLLLQRASASAPPSSLTWPDWQTQRWKARRRAGLNWKLWRSFSKGLQSCGPRRYLTWSTTKTWRRFSRDFKTYPRLKGALWKWGCQVAGAALPVLDMVNPIRAGNLWSFLRFCKISINLSI